MLATLCVTLFAYEVDIVHAGFRSGRVSLAREWKFERWEHPKRYWATMAWWSSSAMVVAALGLQFARQYFT